MPGGCAEIVNPAPAERMLGDGRGSAIVLLPVEVPGDGFGSDGFDDVRPDFSLGRYCAYPDADLGVVERFEPLHLEAGHFLEEAGQILPDGMVVLVLGAGACRSRGTFHRDRSEPRKDLFQTARRGRWRSTYPRRP